VIWRRPRITLLVLLALTVGCLHSMTRLKFLFSAEDMVGEGIPTADEIPEIRDRYQDGTSSILLVLPPEGQFSFTPKELCSIREWFSLLRGAERGLRASFSTFNLKAPVVISPSVVRYQNILQLDCDQGKSLYPLEDVRKNLNAAPWMALRDSKDRLSLIFSFTYETAQNKKFGSFDPSAVGKIRGWVEKDLAKIVPQARFHWVGMADYQWYMKKGFQFAVVVNAMMVIFLIVAMRLCYGTWLSGLMYCSAAVVSGIWLYGGKALADSPYDLLSTGIFLIVCIGGLEDFTFLSAEQVGGKSWRRALRLMIVPSFFTSLTTVIGFASLCTSDLAIIRRFGTWCAAGAALEWVMTFALLPSLLLLFYRKETWVNPAKILVGRNITDWSARRIPRWLCHASLAIFPLTLLLASHIDANDNPALAFPANHPYNQGLRELLDSKGWQGMAYLLADSKLGNPPAPGALDALASQLAASPALQGNIAGYETAEQSLDWLSAKGVLPRKTVELDYQRSVHYEQMVDENRIPRATLYLKRFSVHDLQLLKSEAARICEGGKCHVGGELIAYSDFANRVPRTLIESMAVSMILVGLVLLFLIVAFGKQRWTGSLLASAFWGPCLMLVFMVSFGIQMDFLKCIVASVLVGLTGDNAVQFLFAAKAGELHDGVKGRGAASIQTNVFMAITSLMYLASYFNPPKTFGLLLALGFIVALVGDVWILNGLLDRKKTLPDSAGTPLGVPSRP
jgi:predicted RND superfamily exporter protein